MAAGLRRELTFTPDAASDTASSRSLTDQCLHDPGLEPMRANGDESVVDSLGLQISTDQTPLPSANFFASLQWEDLRTLDGDTFVQIPRRLEQGFCDAVGLALREIIRLGIDSPDSTTAWKALLILPWLLLFRPPDRQGAESCATLLTERLDRFWQGDISSMYREHRSCGSGRSMNPLQASPANLDAVKAKKVRTLARAGETG